MAGSVVLERGVRRLGRVTGADLETSLDNNVPPDPEEEEEGEGTVTEGGEQEEVLEDEPLVKLTIEIDGTTLTCQ